MMRNYVKTTSIITLLLGLFLGGCRNTETKLAEYELTSDLEIEMYPDSSYFSQIRCMQFAGNKLYALDASRRDVAILSPDLEATQFAGTGGRAEYEIFGAEAFYVKSDTVNILDGWNGAIKSYLAGQFIGSHPLPDGLSKRFFIDINGDIFMPVRSEKGTFYRKQQGVEEIEYYGVLEKIGNEIKTLTMNQRFVLSDGHYIFTVPDALTHLEKYDIRTMKQIEKYDLSQIGFINDNLKETAKEDLGDKGRYIFFEDAYLHDNEVFILCNVFGKKFSTNKILRIETEPHMKTVAIYSLPGNVYDSFCVSSNYIFAFNSTDNLIQRFEYLEK